MISSPSCTTSFFETRLRTSESPDWPCSTIPVAPVVKSSAETALDSSVSSAHARRVRRDPRDGADEPVSGHDGRIDRDAIIGAGGDDDRLVEGARRLRDHLGGDAVVLLRERGRVAVVQQALEPGVLLQRRLVLDHLLLELARSRRGASRSRSARRRDPSSSRRRLGTAARRARLRPRAAAARRRRRPARRGAGRPGARGTRP